MAAMGGCWRLKDEKGEKEEKRNNRKKIKIKLEKKPKCTQTSKSEEKV